MDREKLTELQSRVMREALGFVDLPVPDQERARGFSETTFLGPSDDFPPHMYQVIEQVSFAIGYPKGDLKSNSLRLLVLYCKRPAKITPVLEKIREIGGTDCEFIEVGRTRGFGSSWHCKQTRPLRVGNAVGHYKGLTGAITCFATPASAGQLALVSAAHVLAKLGDHAMGDPIIQPGAAYDGSDSRDRIATLTKAVPILNNANERNLVDAAYATLLDEHVPSIPNELFHDDNSLLGRLSSSFASVEVGERVLKLGCSGTTEGRVRAVRAKKVPVWLDPRGKTRARFDNQIIIEGVRDGAFAKDGDSGGLVFKEDLTPVAQILAGSDSGGSNGRGLTYATPINSVLRMLDLAIAA